MGKGGGRGGEVAVWLTRLGRGGDGKQNVLEFCLPFYRTNTQFCLRTTLSMCMAMYWYTPPRRTRGVFLCVCARACVCVCVRACMRVRVCVCV